MSGLVSVTFRPLTPKEIVSRALEAGLECIEWGGDIHVPSGDLATAARVRELCEEAKIKIFSYGSYYRIAASEEGAFADVLASARELGAPIIRVWAYNKGSAEVSSEEYSRAVSDAKRICNMAKDITVCLECHNNTLTDDYLSSLKFLEDVGCNNLRMYWQPNQYRSYEYNLASARAIAPYCRGVHVFSWEGDNRYPLAEHFDRWVSYAKIIADGSPNAELLLEFMHDGSTDSLGQTAAVLRKIIKAAGENKNETV